MTFVAPIVLVLANLGYSEARLVEEEAGEWKEGKPQK